MSASLIVDNLWLGGMQDAATFNAERLCVLEGVHIAPKLTELIKTTKGYHWIEILVDPDRGGIVCLKKLDDAANLISERLVRGAELLVHCGQGIERSPLTLAWWLRRTGQCSTLASAYVRLQKARPVVADRTEWLPPHVRFP